MTLHRIMTGLAKALALLGGAVLVALILLTCLSVIGRSLNTIGHIDWVENTFAFALPLLRRFGPINGDYELVEAGIAFAIFAFLPWCQLTRGHATVELFTSGLPVKANRALMLVWEIVFAAVITIITWRLYVGMSDKMRYGETTFLLQMPVWWAYGICVIAAVVASVVAVYSVWLHANDLRAPRESAPPTSGTPAEQGEGGV